MDKRNITEETQSTVAFYMNELTQLMNHPDSDSKPKWEVIVSYTHQVLQNCTREDTEMLREAFVNIMLTSHKYNPGLLDNRKKNSLERSKRRGQYQEIDHSLAKTYNYLFHILSEATNLAFKRAIARKKLKLDEETLKGKVAQEG